MLLYLYKSFLNIRSILLITLKIWIDFIGIICIGIYVIYLLAIYVLIYIYIIIGVIIRWKLWGWRIIRDRGCLKVISISLIIYNFVAKILSLVWIYCDLVRSSNCIWKLVNFLLRNSTKWQIFYLITPINEAR